MISLSVQAQTGGTSRPGVRSLRVAFSPHLPPAEQCFVVEQAGIRSLTHADQHTGGAPTPHFSGYQAGSNIPLSPLDALAAPTITELPFKGHGSLQEVHAGHRGGNAFPASSHAAASPDEMPSCVGAPQWIAVPAGVAPHSERAVAEDVSADPDDQRHRGNPGGQAAHTGFLDGHADQEIMFDYSEDDDEPSTRATGVYAL